MIVCDLNIHDTTLSLQRVMEFIFLMFSLEIRIQCRLISFVNKIHLRYELDVPSQ